MPSKSTSALPVFIAENLMTLMNLQSIMYDPVLGEAMTSQITVSVPAKSVIGIKEVTIGLSG